MHIKDFAIFLSKTTMSKFLKMGRTEIESSVKAEILEKGLYYFAQDEKIANKIKELQYLKPNPKIKIKSYVCFFCGMPDIEHYMQNFEIEQADNPYLNPNMIVHAIKVLPKEKDIANYKVRGLSDNAIIYEGYCVLPQDEIQIVHLVPDLVRDFDGKPLKNNTGKFDVEFREATPEELYNGCNIHKDYFQFMDEERQRLGYVNGDKKQNERITNLYFGKIEWKSAYRKLQEFFRQKRQRKKTQARLQKLDMPRDDKIEKIMDEYTRDNKNPYRCQEFAVAAAKFLRKGLSQLELKQELEKLTTTNNGEYFRKKFRQIDKKEIIPRGIHGLNHNNRVAVLAMLIAQNEGIFENDEDNRKKDILLSAAYYHDIGRRKGIITDNWGPHGKNSAKKVGKMNLTYANRKAYSLKDVAILQAVIEAHEGFDEDMDGVCEKYGITLEAEKEDVKKLMTILKDADALDRVRTDLNLPMIMRTDLKPKYLRTDTSKRLLDASYQLEILIQNVEIDKVLEYKNPQNSRDIFIERVKTNNGRKSNFKPKSEITLSHEELEL